MRAPSSALLFRESLKIGCLGFGGPVGQIALMHRVFVEERQWIDDARFQRMLAFCMLLPGPEAQQLATYVGWRLRGWAGALIAGWLFVIPGALVVLALSWLYVLYGQAPLVAAAFDGVKGAVVALVAEALLKVGKRALKTRGALLIALASFAALQLGAPFPLVIVVAGVIGFFFTFFLAEKVAAERPDEGRADAPASDRLHAPHPPTPSPQGRGGVSTPPPPPHSIQTQAAAVAHRLPPACRNVCARLGARLRAR